MADHNDIGIRGELIALTHLEKEGYVLLDKNWRFKKDELDLVMRHGRTLVFIEVKTRTNLFAGPPALAVTMAKQKRIVRTAGEYVRDKDGFDEIRFDIIGVVTNSKETSVDHIKEAFYPTL